jgi:hypothetical protein
MTPAYAGIFTRNIRSKYKLSKDFDGAVMAFCPRRSSLATAFRTAPPARRQSGNLPAVRRCRAAYAPVPGMRPGEPRAGRRRADTATHTPRLRRSGRRAQFSALQAWARPRSAAWPYTWISSADTPAVPRRLVFICACT